MMKTRILGYAVLLLTMTLTVVVTGSALATDEKEGPSMVSLADSVDPVKKHFNANRGKHRFITLLSPT